LSPSVTQPLVYPAVWPLLTNNILAPSLYPLQEITRTQKTDIFELKLEVFTFCCPKDESKEQINQEIKYEVGKCFKIFYSQ
jgi:hypothetical protein